VYQSWEEACEFSSLPDSDGEPYCVMMPPPNVTGSLHMGHALNSTLQDVLTRYHRKLGHNTLWQPGMDHAGIATQMVVERQLAEQDIDRRDLGRNAFVDRVWQWKEKSGGQIVNQLRRLGSSPDWSRERFTMDQGLSEAVRKVFIKLYEQGLIYRDKRLVNWDPKLQTAISDLEVELKENEGSLWYFKYPIEDSSDDYIVVATTRPETMFGDTGVAVNPNDASWNGFIGSNAILPLVGRKLPIVGDEHADPEQGSGAVKITPAHDFNDFIVGRRHNLEQINIFDHNACLNENVPSEYRGLERNVARQKVISALENKGLVEKIEIHEHVLPYGDRSGVIVEPWLTDQWFADAKTLAKPAIEAVEDGRIQFIPKHWENTYFEWMHNIQPWCISRQLWWGHRIPAWYGPDNHIFVAMDEEEAINKAINFYGEAVKLSRDPDVLDTWFSSGLWPFSTLGWPNETDVLKTYYPNNDLITGFDIIFFWVARMIMLGMHCMGDVPFKNVYIHALVRDEKGQKMSKSKGNVINPLDLIETYGADAMRFTLAAMEAQGRDIKMSESRVEGYRNFATKLWNAARFCEANNCSYDNDFDPYKCNDSINRWIISETARTAKTITQALNSYRFNEAANAIYQFAWGVFCDWFLEFSKPVLFSEQLERKEETRRTASWVIDQILHLLHPFMPFVTEELWGRLDQTRKLPLISSPWPVLDNLIPQFDKEYEELKKVIKLISGIRTARAEVNIPGGARVPLLLVGEKVLPTWVNKHRQQIIALARLEEISSHTGPPPEEILQVMVEGISVMIPLKGIINVMEERKRLEKELKNASIAIDKIDEKLSNKQFLAKAPDNVISEQQRRKNEAENLREQLQGALARIVAT